MRQSKFGDDRVRHRILDDSATRVDAVCLPVGGSMHGGSIASEGQKTPENKRKISKSAKKLKDKGLSLRTDGKDMNNVA